MNDWIPIFKTGTHTDSNGVEKTWTDSDLDRIVSQYDPKQHEAPVVIGHPSDNSPAWGWVESLKRDGNILYAKLKNLVPEFVDMVRKGLFKKRSISLYPDLSLRHIGFLGAMPPAVKGLPDVAFKAGEKFIEHEFNVFNNFSKQEAKKMKWFEWMKKKAQDEGVMLEDMPGLQDVKTKDSEFAELQKKFEEEKTQLNKEIELLRKEKTQRMKADIHTFCESLCKTGQLTPAIVKQGMGLECFLEKIANIHESVEFSENGEKKTQTLLDYAKSFLSGLKKQIEFEEIASNDKDIPQGWDKRETAIRNYQEKHKDATYRDAVLAVSKEFPELFRN